jgi:predicted nucleic acid-binding protein
MSGRSRYWDACAFLGLLRAESDKLEECRKVIAEAQSGNLVIVTSTLTLAEVLWLKGKDPIPEADREKVRKFFRHAWIVMRELDRATAEQAQEVVWQHGVKPKDAVHVATALRSGVEQLDTFDGPLITLSGKVGNPPLTIGRPNVEGMLFAPEVET